MQPSLLSYKSYDGYSERELRDEISKLKAFANNLIKIIPNN